jgi:hypothetical protein
MLPQMFRLKLSLLIHWHSEPLQSLGANFWGGLPKELLFLQRSSPYSSNLPQDPILKYCSVIKYQKLHFLFIYLFIHLYVVTIMSFSIAHILYNINQMTGRF